MSLTVEQLVPGAIDIRVERLTGQQTLSIEIDRGAIARYGINVADVNEVIETAFGGREVSQLYEGQRRFGIAVRYPESFRNSVEAIRATTLRAPDGTVVYRSTKANGTDKIDYVLTDKDGCTDTGSVLITIKNGVATPSQPNTPSARRIGGYLMWTAFAASCVTSSLFLTALAPNLLAVEMIRGTLGVSIGDKVVLVAMSAAAGLSLVAGWSGGVSMLLATVLVLAISAVSVAILLASNRFLGQRPEPVRP